MPTKSQHRHWLKYEIKGAILFFNGFIKLSNICGGAQVLKIVIFVDISAVSEPILIKQRRFRHLNCMFFQI